MAYMRIDELNDFLSELEFAGLNDHQLFHICRPAFENQFNVAAQLHLKIHELGSDLHRISTSKN